MSDKKITTQEQIGQGQKVPCIRRTIDGREYTVQIHFSTAARETPTQKMERLLRNAVESGKILS